MPSPVCDNGAVSQSKSIFKTLRIIVSILLVTLTGNGLLAQEKVSNLKFRFELRHRFEAWNGMNMKNYGDAGPGAPGSLNDRLLYQRIIAGADYQPADNLKLVFRMQDSRAFGWSLAQRHYPDMFRISATDTVSPSYIMNPNEEFFEIGETYAEYSLNAANLTIRAGRQKFSYGDLRMLGAADWGNTGRWTWDAIKLSYRRNNSYADLFLGGTKTHDPMRLNIPFTESEFFGAGIYGHIESNNVSASGKYLPVIEPFMLLKKEGSAPYIRDRDINRYWSGLRIYSSSVASIVYDATLVKQWGIQDGRSIDAHAWAMKLGYRFTGLPTRPVLFYRNTYASGGYASDQKIRTFDPAFGGNDRYYGRMNILTWSNMRDNEAGLEVTPIKGASVEILYHHLSIPFPESARILGTMQLESGTHFGNEFDISFRYQLSSGWQFTSVFGYFRPGNLMDINGSPPKSASLFSFQVLYTR